MKTAFLLAAAAAAAGAQGVRAEAPGATLFARHCAVCHGESGRGDGPMAGVMVIKPADLTSLAAANGGTFPTARVIARIDGREALVSHGSPMPVYGPFFEGPAMTVILEDGEKVRAPAAIALLLDELKSMQE